MRSEQDRTLGGAPVPVKSGWGRLRSARAGSWCRRSRRPGHRGLLSGTSVSSETVIRCSAAPVPNRILRIAVPQRHARYRRRCWHGVAVINRIRPPRSMPLAHWSCSDCREVSHPRRPGRPQDLLCRISVPAAGHSRRPSRIAEVLAEVAAVIEPGRAQRQPVRRTPGSRTDLTTGAAPSAVPEPLAGARLARCCRGAGAGPGR